MTLQEHIDSLPKEKQFILAIEFARLTIPVWEKYADHNNLSYRDTVVGLIHSVDKNLLRRTVNAIESYTRASPLFKFIIRNMELKNLKKQLRDPIVALEDSDWELPYEVEKAFYSINNLLDTVLGKEMNGFNETMIYVTVNQAIDALVSSKSITTGEIKTMLYGTNGR